jgi:hypothetical protein
LKKDIIKNITVTSFYEAIALNKSVGCLNHAIVHKCTAPANTCIRQLIYSKYANDTEPAIVYSCGYWDISDNETVCVQKQDINRYALFYTNHV